MAKPGTYIAKVVEYGLVDPEGKNPHTAIRFKFKNPETNQDETILYFGYLTEASTPYTLKNLITCGLKEASLLSLLVKDPWAFEDKEIEIVLRNEEFNGQTQLRVKFVNEIGGSWKWKDCNPKIAKQIYGGFDEALKNLKAGTYKMPDRPKKVANSDVTFNDSDFAPTSEVPF